MLISATKLSCCLLQNPVSLLFFLSGRLERREKGGRKREKGASKTVARTRGNMKVDLLESGKEGRAGQRSSLAVLMFLVEQAQAGPPDNEAETQEQCRSARSKPYGHRTPENWASGASLSLSSSYRFLHPLSSTAQTLSGGLSDLQFALLPFSPEGKGAYLAYCATLQYFCWVAEFCALHGLTSTVL